MTTEIVKERFDRWIALLDSSDPMYSELISASDEEINDRFYSELSFGTAGLRGIMGAGSNRLNPVTVSAACYGLAAFVKEQNASPSVAVAYDSRHNSKEFALLTARVLSSLGVKVWLHKTLTPTPMLSYAVRALGCTGGVMITASHNPREYNGFKVYGSDGAQTDEEAAARIYEYIKKADGFSLMKLPGDNALIEEVPETVSEDFYKEALAAVREKDVIKEAGLSVVYTPLNGAGLVHVKELLSRLGIKDVHVVASQELPNGDFPTTPKPNPELPEAFSEALKLAEEKKPDLIIATDPDSDRIACGVRHGDGYTLLSGNELGVLFIDFELDRRAEHCEFAHDPYVIRTIVSTPMADIAAEYYGCRTVTTLTGFKNIAAVLRENEKTNPDGFVMGFEESIGYMFGTFVRDKDAVSSAAKLCEMTAWYKKKDMTLIDALEMLYERLGYCLGRTLNYYYEGAEGKDRMASITESLRSAPPRSIGGLPVLFHDDLSCGKRYTEGKEEPSPLPRGDVLSFTLRDDCSVLVRPSGTEPKLKVYCTACADTRQEAAAILENMAAEMEKLCKK